MFTSKHCKLIRKNNFDALLMTESLCSTMNVRSPKPWDTKHGITQYFRFTVDMFFVFDFFISDWKKHTLFIIWMLKRVKSIVFAVSIKFCGESGRAISSFNLVLTSSIVREIIKLFSSTELQVLTMNYYLIN